MHAIPCVFNQHNKHPSHHQYDLKIQTAEPAGKCLCGETELVYPYPPTRPRVPRHQAAQPGTSGFSMLWLEGKSIVDMCTVYRRGRRKKPLLCWSWLATCSSTRYIRYMYMLAYTGNNADFAMTSARLGRHASCGILMPPSFCGFPHTVLRRGRVACLHSRSPESILSYPAWVQRECADGEIDTASAQGHWKAVYGSEVQ
jgi:hypothetical protein